MKRLTRSVIALVVLAAVVALVPFFVTLNDYVPLVEKELSARLNAPVSIDTLHVSLLPTPHVRIDGIAIGKAGEIKVAKAVLQPDLWSLFGSNKVIRSVEFEHVVLSQSALGPLVALAKKDNRSSGTLTIKSIKLKSAVVKLDEASFGPFDMDVQAGRGGTRGEVKLATQDGSVQARLTPEGDAYSVEASAKSWTPPLGPKIHFDALHVKGIAGSDEADLNEVDAKLYGGTIGGKATINWAKGISLKGDLDVKEVELRQAAGLLSTKTRVSGRLDAKPVFSSRAAKAAQLGDALRLETPFTVRNGVLYGLDLPGAVSALTKRGKGDGQTQFDELKGRLVLERGAYRFTNLRIASGVLSARGNVTIGANKSLSGRLSTSAQALGAVTNVPLVVAGTLESPKVYPDPTALVGAAVGSTVLGPGIGTAAGAKAGEIVEELFGNKR
jgi:uncharacterized protein involved in outer membrane biogenesis